MGLYMPRRNTLTAQGMDNVEKTTENRWLLSGTWLALKYLGKHWVDHLVIWSFGAIVTALPLFYKMLQSYLTRQELSFKFLLGNGEILFVFASLCWMFLIDMFKLGWRYSTITKIYIFSNILLFNITAVSYMFIDKTSIEDAIYAMNSSYLTLILVLHLSGYFYISWMETLKEIQWKNSLPW